MCNKVVVKGKDVPLGCLVLRPQAFHIFQHTKTGAFMFFVALHRAASAAF